MTRAEKDNARRRYRYRWDDEYRAREQRQARLSMRKTALRRWMEQQEWHEKQGMRGST